VENAIKFSDEGPVRVLAFEEGGSVLMTISNPGEGIDQERLSRLFSGPGPRGQRAPTATGLGLLLTQRVLQAQGASISVESRLGEGTTFTMRLPAKGEAG
jgi:signal transduction histidine kinase